MWELDGNTVAPHAVMHHFHDFFAGHVTHHAAAMQQSVAPVARVFGPSHDMRIVVAHASIKAYLRLQGALSMFGTAFVDMANIHAAILAVKGHWCLRLRIGNSHCSGGPIFIAC